MLTVVYKPFSLQVSPRPTPHPLNPTIYSTHPPPPVKEELQMAQHYLEQALEHDMAGFLSSLSQVISGVHYSAVSRIQAGLQIKNALYSKHAESRTKKREKWSSISTDIRCQIKKNVCFAYAHFTSSFPAIVAFYTLDNNTFKAIQSIKAIHCIVYNTLYSIQSTV